MPGAAVKFDSGAFGSAKSGTITAPPPLLTLITPEVTTAPEMEWGSDPIPEIRGPLIQATASPGLEGEPPFRRVHLGRKGEMGSIPHPKEVCEHPNSHAERKLRDRWDAALRLFSTGGVGDILCEIAAKEFHLPPSHPRVQGYACTKIYRAAGESRVNAARLALEDLARFEGSDPQLSLFRRRCK